MKTCLRPLSWQEMTQTSHEDKVNEIFHWKLRHGFVFRLFYDFFFFLIFLIISLNTPLLYIYFEPEKALHA